MTPFFITIATVCFATPDRARYREHCKLEARISTYAVIPKAGETVFRVVLPSKSYEDLAQESANATDEYFKEADRTWCVRNKHRYGELQYGNIISPSDSKDFQFEEYQVCMVCGYKRRKAQRVAEEKWIEDPP